MVEYNRPGLIFMYVVYAIILLLFLVIKGGIVELLAMVGWFPVVLYHVLYIFKNKKIF